MGDLYYRGRFFVYSIIAATGSAFGVSSLPLYPCVIMPLVLGLVAVIALIKSKKKYAPVIFCLLFLYGGLSYGLIRASGWQGRAGPKGNVILEGRVEVACRGSQDDIIDIFRVERVLEGEGARKGDGYLLRARGEATDFEWGDSLRVSGNLYLFENVRGGVGGSLIASEAKVTGHTRNPLLRLAVSYRKSLRGQVADVLSPDVAGLIEGMVLGDYRRLGGRDLRAFRLAGLIHLCAASGLHVAILVGFILWVGKRLRLSHRTILLVQIPLLATYALAVGLSIPIQRATMVAAVAAAAYFMGRDFDFIAAMGAAVFYMVWSDPGAATGVSFQLCFAAALGMVLLYRPLARLFGSGTSKAVALLAATLAAQLAVAPLLLFHFGEVSVLAPLANVLALPLVAPVMALAMLSSLFCIAGLPLADILITAAAVPARLMLAIARLMAAPTWSALNIFPFSPIWMAVYFPALAAAFLFRKRWRTVGRWTLILLILAAVVAGGVFPVGVAGAGSGTRITFMDVGQGDAALLQSDGVSILIDGGKDMNVLSRKLKSRGVRYLDAIVFSHPEADHIGGLPAALDECKVGLLVHPGLQTGPMGEKLLAQAEELGVPSHLMRKGDSLKIGGINLRALGPPADIPEEGPANEYSLVLRADIEGLTILFTGDIEEEGQGFLLSEPAMLHADILKIPHHGGFAETGEKFFAAVRASVAVISVGRDNSYGHPSRGTLESLDRCGCSIYRTDLNGDVVIEGLPHCLEVKCDKSGESCGLGYKWPIAA